jgi:hypothetical protein
MSMVNVNTSLSIHTLPKMSGADFRTTTPKPRHVNLRAIYIFKSGGMDKHRYYRVDIANNDSS